MSELPLSLVERCQARVGTTLRGKWTLDTLIDVGGMAAVYAATHRNGNRVAIKMLHPEALLVAGVRQRLLKEGYVANQIGHRGAVRVLDDDETEDGVAFLVMELLEGETLQARMDRHGGRLTVEDVLCITDKVLDILAAAHTKDIFHRDIKPANIFITLGAEVKLLDFGIARARQMTERTGGIHAPTMAGTVLGTPGYIPPEQAYGRVDELDARSDLWAVGAMMFATLSGRCAHEATTINEQLILAATRPAASLATVVPQAPPALVALVDRSLAYRKEDRFQTAAQMGKAVQDVFYQIEGFRISRDNHMAAVAAEIPGARPADSSTEPTMPLGEVAPPRAAPTLIGHPVHAPQTQHAVVTPADAQLPEPAAARSFALSSRAAPFLFGAAALVAVGVVAVAFFRLLPTGDADSTGGADSASGADSAQAPASSNLVLSAPGSGAPPQNAPPEVPAAAGSTAISPPDPPRLAEPLPSSRPKTEPTTSSPKPAAEAPQGTLNINSIPVSKVILDGKPLGETPKVGLKVAPGLHQVTFVHPTMGRKSVAIQVAAGEVKAAAVKFEGGTKGPR